VNLRKNKPANSMPLWHIWCRNKSE
jgi:hypothetical protein